MSQIFKEGEVVFLASGSPDMTVEGYTKDQPPLVRCVWIDKGKACRDVFLVSSLKPKPSLASRLTVL